MKIVPELQTLKAGGARIIGCFPLYPPLELMHSLGLTPVVLWDFPNPFPSLARADRRLQRFACAVGRRLTEFILSREGEVLDGLFMYNACDTLRNLPEILAAGLNEQGRSLPLVRTHLPQVPPAQTPWADYLRTRFKNLIRDLEKTFGVHFSPENFRRSVDRYEQMRALCRALEARTADGRISYGLFSRTLRENCFRPLEAQIAVLKKILAENPPCPVQARFSGRPIPVVLSGILPPSPDLIRTIEDAGLRVAGNDLAVQRRSYGYSPSDLFEPGDYYLDFYSNHVACPTLLYTADGRLEEIKTLVRNTQARGLIFLGEKFCEYEYFEIPFLERMLQDRGVSVACLEISGNEQNQAPLATRIQAFAEMLRGL